MFNQVTSDGGSKNDENKSTNHYKIASQIVAALVVVASRENTFFVLFYLNPEQTLTLKTSK